MPLRLLTSRTAAWVLAAVTMILGAYVLRRAFGVGASSGQAALPLWSLLLAAVWTLGGIALLAAERARRRAVIGEPDGGSGSEPGGGAGARIEAAHRAATGSVLTLPTGAALLRSAGIGCALALASFVGGWILIHIPFAAVWIGHALTTAGTSAAWLTLLAAFVTGLSEEVFFRLGLASLFTGRARWIVPTLIYTVVTCATGNLGLIAAAPLVGFAAAWAVETTGRWFAPLIVHGLWSLVMVGLFPQLVSLPGAA